MRANAVPSIAAATFAATLLAGAPAHADSLTAGRVVTPAGAEVCSFSVANSAGGGRSALLYATGRNCGEAGAVMARLGRGRDLRPRASLERRPASSALRIQIFGQPRVAAAADGTVAAAWIVRGREGGRDQLRVAIAAPGRGFAAPATLARQRFRSGYVPELELTGLVAGRRGRIVASWTVGSTAAPRSVRAAVRLAGGSFRRPQTLGQAGSSSLSVSPSGIVVAAWKPAERDSATAATLPARRERFLAPRRVSGADEAAQIQAAGGPGGAGVSWQTRSADGARILLRLARLRRDAVLAPAATIAVADTPAVRSLEVDGPQVAFAARGPFAAWRLFRDISEAGDGRVDSTSVHAAALPGAATMLSPAGALTGVPVLAALSDRALVAWSERGGPGEARLRLAVGEAGRWAPARTLLETSGQFATGPLTIAAGRRNALIAWQANTRTDRRLRLALYNR